MGKENNLIDVAYAHEYTKTIKIQTSLQGSRNMGAEDLIFANH